MENYDSGYRIQAGHSNSLVPFSSIPSPLYNDFLQLMTGRTFAKREGQFLAYPSDFKDLLRKLSIVGITHEQFQLRMEPIKKGLMELNELYHVFQKTSSFESWTSEKKENIEDNLSYHSNKN